MSSYKLTYFPFRGRGELIRLILHYAKVPFEDNRITLEDWPSLKKSLVGQDDWEAAQIDALADFHKDFGNETQDYIMILTGRRQGDKETVYKEKFLPAVEKTFPILIKYLNVAGNGFFFKSGISWVDFFIANNILRLNALHPELFEKYHELKEHCDRVHSLPQIKDYVESRPKTEF
uniref:glutathione transferase n=1 Tax=Acrobeloides nanus TaxID=290746 RepID=A0A914C6E8_9BILA